MPSSKGAKLLHHIGDLTQPMHAVGVEHFHSTYKEADEECGGALKCQRLARGKLMVERLTKPENAQYANKFVRQPLGPVPDSVLSYSLESKPTADGGDKDFLKEKTLSATDRAAHASEADRTILLSQAANTLYTHVSHAVTEKTLYKEACKTVGDSKFPSTNENSKNNVAEPFTCLLGPDEGGHTFEDKAWKASVGPRGKDGAMLRRPAFFDSPFKHLIQQSIKAWMLGQSGQGTVASAVMKKYFETSVPSLEHEDPDEDGVAADIFPRPKIQDAKACNHALARYGATVAKEMYYIMNDLVNQVDKGGAAALVEKMAKAARAEAAEAAGEDEPEDAPKAEERHALSHLVSQLLPQAMKLTCERFGIPLSAMPAEKRKLANEGNALVSTYQAKKNMLARGKPKKAISKKGKKSAGKEAAAEEPTKGKKKKAAAKKGGAAAKKGGAAAKRAARRPRSPRSPRSPRARRPPTMRRSTRRRRARATRARVWARRRAGRRRTRAPLCPRSTSPARSARCPASSRPRRPRRRRPRRRRPRRRRPRPAARRPPARRRAARRRATSPRRPRPRRPTPMRPRRRPPVPRSRPPRKRALLPPAERRRM